MLKKWLITPAALAAFSALVGCTTPNTDQSLYQRLGGKEAITAVVTDAMGNISADTRINRRFEKTNGPQLTKSLSDFICARSGGPCTYTGRDMSAAHDGMNITDAEFDALVEDLVKSIDKFKVPEREKGEVLRMLGQMRNAIVGH